MDFSRSSQPVASRTAGGGASEGSKKNGSWRGSPKWLRVIWVFLLFAVTILVIAVLALLYVGGDKQSKIIDKSKFQAVFLTNGQVYFGNIVTANKDFVDLKNIYYLSVGNQQVQPKDNKETSVSLVKLGCELHGPVDEMVINRDQVTFWENLKTDGQVSQAIDKWVEQNPEGQKCGAGNAQTSQDALHKQS
ncbi:MAG TPA: hypothetical protein VFB59_02005 [Candidatus Saccharimonadales bacterium]|nr:hypothetical protein [Candidatus Saccharimonadales bacterium]